MEKKSINNNKRVQKAAEQVSRLPQTRRPNSNRSQSEQRAEEKRKGKKRVFALQADFKYQVTLSPVAMQSKLADSLKREKKRQKITF